jgi:hypothetical protein
MFDAMTGIDVPPAPMSAENRLHNLGVGVRELWFQYENARNTDTEKAL